MYRYSLYFQYWYSLYFQYWYPGIRHFSSISFLGYSIYDQPKISILKRLYTDINLSVLTTILNISVYNMLLNVCCLSSQCFMFVLVTTLLSCSVSYQYHCKVMCFCGELHFGLTEENWCRITVWSGLVWPNRENWCMITFRLTAMLSFA